MTNSKIVTVLGASGNIGKLLVEYLATKDYIVRAVGRSEPKFNLKNVQDIAIDYDSQKELVDVCAGSQYVFMLVGLEYSTKTWQEKWLPLATRVVEATKKAEAKLIFLDNVYGYGLVDGKMQENTPLNAKTKKGLVRKQIDELIQYQISKGELKAVLAKSADFYGPGITTSVIGDRFFDLVLNKNTFEWFGNIAKKHNYTFVLDIPPALEKLATSDFLGNIHLPTSNPQTGFEFHKLLEKLTGKKLKVTSLRQNTVWWLGWFMPILKELHEMMYQSENDYDFDSSKISHLFPDLKTTSYDEGFEKTLNWYKNHLKN